MEFRTLENVDAQLIVNTFNEAFSDYYVPLSLTLEQFLLKTKGENFAPHLSVGAFENQKLVGIIVHYHQHIDGKYYVYNGGTGVIPAKRGQALTTRMYQYILPVLRANNVDYSILEVLHENIQAIKSYQRVGFYTDRNLIFCEGTLNPSNINNPTISIKPLENYDWPQLVKFWEIIPSWQNKTFVIDNIKTEVLGFAAYANGQLVGYIIYNPIYKRIQSLAVEPNFRNQGIASTLLNHLYSLYPEKMRVVNIDAKAMNFVELLKKRGLENTHMQHEMILDLRKT